MPVILRFVANFPAIYFEAEQPPVVQDNRSNRSTGVPKCGISLIKEFEGYHRIRPDGRVDAYEDPLHGWSVPTIGYGTTIYPDGKHVKQGDIIDRARAEECLIVWVEKNCRTKLEAIPTWNRMTDNQRGALYSFAYNLGSGFYGKKDFASITNLCDSPGRWGDKSWVEQQFVKYRNPGTAAEEGLLRRRKAEAKLFCTP
ncbi:MAG: lysozyme [Methylococcaceae bacterium]|nr:lysozyme [Methylococcaceae bacterium]